MNGIPGIGAEGGHRIKLPRCGRSPCGASAAHGFTLLEVLIAFSLLAIGLGILLSILSSGVHAISRASDSTRASLYAQGLLDSIGVDKRLRPGRSQGAFENGRYRWTLDIAPLQTPAATPAPGTQPGLAQAQGAPSENVMLQLILQMQWNGGGSGNSLRVDTLRAYAPALEVQQ